MRTVRTPNILPVHSVNVLDGMSIVYVFHILLGSKNFLIFYPFMYILVAYPEHPHGMRDANIPLYIPGISLGWRVLVGVSLDHANYRSGRSLEAEGPKLPLNVQFTHPLYENTHNS
jgi:hypothetical protein